MSIGVMRVQKFKGGSSVAGLQIHNRRERGHSNSNLDIDFSKRDLNYSLIETDNRSFNEKIEERIKQGYTGKTAIKKNAVKLCEVLFTSDTEFFDGKTEQEQKRFFADCLDWVEKRFGKENIVSAVVHMDEKTPHLHVDFVPVLTDGRLSARDLFGGREKLQALQDAFYDNVCKPFGLERGTRCDIGNPEDKPRKHKSTETLKRESADTLEILGKQIKHFKKMSEEYEAPYRKISREVALLSNKQKNLSNELYSSTRRLSEQRKIAESVVSEAEIKAKDIIDRANERYKLLTDIGAEERHKILDNIRRELMDSTRGEREKLIKEAESIKARAEEREKMLSDAEAKAKTIIDASKNETDSAKLERFRAFADKFIQDGKTITQRFDEDEESRKSQIYSGVSLGRRR
jgi:vacuolar-type H+-ATPase subunit E/Vma4